MCSGMCDLTRKFAVFAVISALLTQGSYAQGLPDMQELPASSRQKAAEELKKAQEKAADEVYEAMVKRVEHCDNEICRNRKAFARCAMSALQWDDATCPFGDTAKPAADPWSLGRSIGSAPSLVSQRETGRGPVRIPPTNPAHREA